MELFYFKFEVLQSLILQLYPSEYAMASLLPFTDIDVSGGEVQLVAWREGRPGGEKGAEERTAGTILMTCQRASLSSSEESEDPTCLRDQAPVLALVLMG